MRGKGYYKAAKGDNGSKKNVNLKNRKYARGRYIIKNRNVDMFKLKSAYIINVLINVKLRYTCFKFIWLVDFC